MQKAEQSRWVRKARTALGLTVQELAEIINVSSRTINAWENEQNNNLPSREKLFSYLSLLAGDRVLIDPTQLLKARFLDVIDRPQRDHLELSHMFTRLSRNSRFMVNRVIRSIYRSE